MFDKLDGNSLLNAMFPIVKQIRIKRNPVNGRGLLTNYWTQLLGNRVLSLNAEWKQTGVKAPIQIELVNFMPARNPKTGKVVKDLSGDMKAQYELGLPDSELAIQEFGYVLSYFTACFSTGNLPTPTKYSGQSTIMAKIVQNWREMAGLKPNWIEIVGKTGIVRRMTEEHINAIQTVFVANYDHILATWDTGDARPDTSANRIEWL